MFANRETRGAAGGVGRAGGRSGRVMYCWGDCDGLVAASDGTSSTFTFELDAGEDGGDGGGGRRIRTGERVGERFAGGSGDVACCVGVVVCWVDVGGRGAADAVGLIGVEDCCSAITAVAEDESVVAAAYVVISIHGKHDVVLELMSAHKYAPAMLFPRSRCPRSL